MSDVLCTATEAPFKIELQGLDEENNDTHVLGNGADIFDISVDNPIVTLAHDGHGMLDCDAQTPVGTGVANVTANFSEGGGPTKPVVPFKIIVGSGETAKADARRVE